MSERLLKRLKKKAKRGMRGWPVATIAYYGPDRTRATKVAVGIIPSEDAEPSEMRDWSTESGDVRNDLDVAGEVVEFIESQGALSAVMADGIMGCPHQQGIDYDGARVRILARARSLYGEANPISPAVGAIAP